MLANPNNPLYCLTLSSASRKRLRAADEAHALWCDGDGMCRVILFLSAGCFSKTCSRPPPQAENMVGARAVALQRVNAGGLASWRAGRSGLHPYVSEALRARAKGRRPAGHREANFSPAEFGERPMVRGLAATGPRPRGRERVRSDGRYARRRRNIAGMILPDESRTADRAHAAVRGRGASPRRRPLLRPHARTPAARGFDLEPPPPAIWRSTSTTPLSHVGTCSPLASGSGRQARINRLMPMDETLAARGIDGADGRRTRRLG